MKKLRLWALPAFLLAGSVAYGQNVGINNDGASPDNSAMLDVKSSDKGILIPRMTEVNRLAIPNPAVGLIVYQTDQTIGLYFNEGPGTNWKYINSAGVQGPTGPTGPIGPTGPSTGAAGGDLTGNYPNPLIGAFKVTTPKIADSAVSSVKLLSGAVHNVHIQNGTISPGKLSSSGASSGQVLGYNGTNVVWGPDGLTLPYSRTTSAASALVGLSQTGTGSAVSLGIANASSTERVLEVEHNGIGGGISVVMSNASNGARGLDVAQSGVGPGVFATSSGGNAVWGITSSISAAGVIGDNTRGEAVVGRNRGGTGVGAVVGRNDSSGYGVRGFNTKNGIGVLGQAGISGGTGVAGRFENVNAANSSDALEVLTNGSGNAARFTGNVVVNGNLTVSGTVAKGGGTFKIDHPLDPKNKVLYHSFVESPEMKNIYDGVVVLDRDGKAQVKLPSWFQALNGHFCYQLTAIGGPGAGLFIAEEVKNNQFSIAGGTPGMKVSWQVTGVRQDAYARKYPIQVEVDKSVAEKGTYIHPAAYNAEVKVAPATLQANPKTASMRLASDGDVR